MSIQVIYTCDSCRNSADPITPTAPKPYGTPENSLPSGWVHVAVESSVTALPEAFSKVIDAAYATRSSAMSPLLEMIKLQATPIQVDLLVCPACVQSRLGSVIPAALAEATEGLVDSARSQVELHLVAPVEET